MNQQFSFPDSWSVLRLVGLFAFFPCRGISLYFTVKNRCTPQILKHVVSFDSLTWYFYMKQKLFKLSLMKQWDVYFSLHLWLYASCARPSRLPAPVSGDAISNSPWTAFPHNSRSKPFILNTEILTSLFLLRTIARFLSFLITYDHVIFIAFPRYMNCS